jgi:hypothetical protein
MFITIQKKDKHYVNETKNVRYEMFTAQKIHVVVFQIVVPCNLMVWERCTGLHGVIIERTAVW